MKSDDKQKENKAEAIIAAAQKRFALFGIEKTPMREIARDLRISKAALYYYFPDKESLYKSVLTREHDEFLRILHTEIENSNDPVDNLRKFSQSRISYFRKLSNLGRLTLDSYDHLKPVIANLLEIFREEEKRTLVLILEKGIRQDLFRIDDTYKIATLFLDIIRGQIKLILSGKDLLMADDAEFTLLSEKVKDMSDVFIKGLLYK
ncbi:MAG TPA: TetR/AcrR family transcriptional regulator [Bacteroidales bacterium]|mgnify:FL=1|jgi:TetR/AcrR family transcriptional repressor of mexJK operon|nr:TetR family transcriptional regulator [Bacteroidales bacterium]HNR41131.1 TetR/AcrR family transcriptional regulator [Bacteroidales bacterium]HPM17524.1 TetR/AcrR family transcriptional regulator [Bacteroidales bacterium]